MEVGKKTVQRGAFAIRSSHIRQGVQQYASLFVVRFEVWILVGQAELLQFSIPHLGPFFLCWITVFVVSCVCCFDEIHDGSRHIAKINHICFWRRKLFLTSDFCFGTFDPRLQQHESFGVEHKFFWVVLIVLLVLGSTETQLILRSAAHLRPFIYSSEFTATLRRGDLDFWGFLLTVSFVTSFPSFCSVPCPLASWKFVSKPSRCTVFRSENWTVHWICFSTFWLHVGLEDAFFFEQLWWWQFVLQTRRKVWKYTTVSSVWLRYFAKVVKGCVRYFYTSDLTAKLGWCVQTKRITRSWRICPLFAMLLQKAF